MSKTIKKTYTRDEHLSALMEAVNDETKKHYIILNYLMNLHSHTLAEGGLDYKKAYEAVEDYENFLVRDIAW